MSIDQLELSLSAVQLLGIALVWIYSWWMQKQKASASEIRAANERIDTAMIRLTQIETARGFLPTHADIGKIYQSIDGLSREVAELRGTTLGTQRLVEGINRHLMEHDK